MAANSCISGVNVSAQSLSTVGRKKKKGKSQKVLDPTILGFRAIGDPNRFNAGKSNFFIIK